MNIGCHSLEDGGGKKELKSRVGKNEFRHTQIENFGQLLLLLYFCLQLIVSMH